MVAVLVVMVMVMLRVMVVVVMVVTENSPALALAPQVRMIVVQAHQDQRLPDQAHRTRGSVRPIPLFSSLALLPLIGFSSAKHHLFSLTSSKCQHCPCSTVGEHHSLDSLIQLPWLNILKQNRVNFRHKLQDPLEPWVARFQYLISNRNALFIFVTEPTQ